MMHKTCRKAPNLTEHVRHMDPVCKKWDFLDQAGQSATDNCANNREADDRDSTLILCASLAI